MTQILKQSPHIIDSLLTPETRSLEDQSAFVLSSTDYERRLEALRRFVNEQLFRRYTAFLEGQDTAQDLQRGLTALAEKTLDLSIRIVADDLGLEHLPMTVLGLGKMGSATMAPQSDLDLVFLFSDAFDPELSAKVVRRLRTTLTTPLREGIAYELDMRLRPSGRSGPPAVKLSAFRDHHMFRAHSWEHIALAPSRVVAGDAELGLDVMALKARILTRPRQAEAFIRDAHSMYGRLRTERIIVTPPETWRSKLREGGLMQADFLLSSFAVLDEPAPAGLSEAAEAWRRLQVWERLLGLTGRKIDNTPDRYADAIGCKGLQQRVEALEKDVIHAADALFADVAAGQYPDPRPVIWENPS